MRPLRYSINVTLDGCCDHRAMLPDEDLHRHAAENLSQADALLFGRVTYEMMEAAWRPPVRTGARPEWMEPFARTIDAAKKYVVSSTLDRVDWNAELVRGDLTRLRLRPTRCTAFPPNSERTWVSFASWRLCVRLIRHAVGNARDAVFDEGDIEINEQAQAFVGQPEMCQQLLLRDGCNRLHGFDLH